MCRSHGPSLRSQGRSRTLKQRREELPGSPWLPQRLPFYEAWSAHPGVVQPQWAGPPHQSAINKVPQTPTGASGAGNSPSGGPSSQPCQADSHGQPSAALQRSRESDKPLRKQLKVCVCVCACAQECTRKHGQRDYQGSSSFTLLVPVSAKNKLRQKCVGRLSAFKAALSPLEAQTPVLREWKGTAWRDSTVCLGPGWLLCPLWPLKPGT